MIGNTPAGTGLEPRTRSEFLRPLAALLSRRLMTSAESLPACGPVSNNDAHMRSCSPAEQCNLCHGQRLGLEAKAVRSKPSFLPILSPAGWNCQPSKVLLSGLQIGGPEMLAQFIARGMNHHDPQAMRGPEFA